MDVFDFRSKLVVVTGGSRGLGLALCREAGRRGANVAFCARDRAEIERAESALREEGFAAEGYACDVSDRVQAAAFIGRVIERHGPIDVLINDAGVIEVGPFQAMNGPDFDEAMSVNFFGALNTMLPVVEHMRGRGGRIVNVGSIGGRIGVPHLAPYCASKFALTGFCESIRPELRRQKIVLTLVQPWLMRTGSPRNAFFKGRNQSEYAWFSVADSVLSVGAQRAAKAILKACARGAPETAIGFPAWTALVAHRIAPRFVRACNAIADRFLPHAGGIGRARARGYESTSPVSESPLNIPNRQAEMQYGQKA